MKKSLLILIILFVGIVRVNSAELEEYFYDLANRTEDVELKENFLKKSIEVNPVFKKSYIELSKLYNDAGQTDKAKDLMDKFYNNMENQKNMVDYETYQTEDEQTQESNEPIQKKKKSYIKYIVAGVAVIAVGSAIYYWRDDIKSYTKKVFSDNEDENKVENIEEESEQNKIEPEPENVETDNEIPPVIQEKIDSEQQRFENEINSEIESSIEKE
jgi:hypothetical protein